MEKIDAIFFIGPQGSGKGTQARKLAERLGFFYWEMGGILRDESKKDTALGKRLAEQINAGVLLGDELLLEVFKSRMSELPVSQGVIFDGVPRRIGQAEFVMNLLHEQGRSNFVTLFINVPKTKSLERLLKRAELEGRVDDTQEKIEFRLEQYYKDTVPMLDLMKQHSNFIDIDGTPAVDVVESEILHKLRID